MTLVTHALCSASRRVGRGETLSLPGGTVRIAGRVVYTNVPGNLQRSALPHGMAVRFTEGDADAFELIPASVDATLSEFAL